MLHTRKIMNELSWDIHKLINQYGYKQVYSWEDLKEKTFFVEKKGDFHFITYNSPENNLLNFDDVVDFRRLEE